MPFRFHDSLTREVREFVTAEPGVVRMYTCGPTVYSYQHIGNYRAYTCWDVLRRALELGGYEVRQVVNITDVGHLTVDDVADAVGEDKMEKASRREGLDAWAVAKKYTDYFFEIARKLNWRAAERYPRATDHVPEMIAHVEELIRRGNAYATPAGNVYFEVATFPAYGRLSGNTIDDLVAGARVEVLAEKRHPADFALWKRDEGHQMQWDSPWGRGFPGWHIECSVMARKYLGETLDIHTGGEDHLFPHHECEIAQSEAVTGKPLARHWMHNRFILVDGAKMAKSRGTMYVMEDVERVFDTTKATGVHGTSDAAKPKVDAAAHRALRYFLLSAHYRAPVNFTWDALDAARSAVEGLDAMARNVTVGPRAASERGVAKFADDVRARFLSALQDDLNVSAALAVVHELRAFVHKNAPYTPAEHASLRGAIETVDTVLGLDLAARVPSAAPEAPSAPGGFVVEGPDDPAVRQLLVERDAARKSKDFARADAIRKQLEAQGIVLEDKPGRTIWFRRG